MGAKRHGQPRVPGTLEIVITERKLGAIVEIPMGATQTIQKLGQRRGWNVVDGRSRTGFLDRAKPQSEDLRGRRLGAAYHRRALWFDARMGTRCSDANVNNALAIVAGMTTELAGQVTTVSATDEESTLLTLESGIEIAFGPAEDIREEERVCLKVIEEHPGVVLHQRSHGRPRDVARSLGAAADSGIRAILLAALSRLRTCGIRGGYAAPALRFSLQMGLHRVKCPSCAMLRHMRSSRLKNRSS